MWAPKAQAMWETFTEALGLAAQGLVILVAVLAAVALPAYVIIQIVLALTHGAIPI
jgi:hypothetical protein